MNARGHLELQYEVIVHVISCPYRTDHVYLKISKDTNKRFHVICLSAYNIS